MGTLAGVLAEKQIPTPAENFRAAVEGDIEDVDGVLKILKINAKYHLTVPTGKDEEAKQALGLYLTKCPASQSVIGCINILDSTEIRTTPDEV